jgi:hypothetical protein
MQSQLTIDEVLTDIHEKNSPDLSEPQTFLEWLLSLLAQLTKENAK